jgi:hypothetical protein
MTVASESTNTMHCDACNGVLKTEDSYLVGICQRCRGSVWTLCTSCESDPDKVKRATHPNCRQ